MGSRGEGTPRPRHIDALDGLRGLAILLVLTVHLWWLGFGWIGVQLFFVLSGFLITRILLHTAPRMRLSEYLKDFYLRRALRIFPLYFGYLALLLLLVLGFDRFDTVGDELPWAATFTYNLHKLVTDAPMAGQNTEVLLLRHFWSLCVEEHFYLFWPLVVYFFHRRILSLALGLILLGPLLRVLTVEIWPSVPGVSVDAASAVYLVSLSHLDAFAAGALLSALPAAGPRSARIGGIVLLVGIAVAVVAGGVANGGWTAPVAPGTPPLHFGYPHPMERMGQEVWGYTVINLLAALALWLAVSGGALQRVFAQGWLRYTGRISFGMYVIHFPLLIGLMTLAPLVRGWLGHPLLATLVCQAAYIGLVYALAAASFRWYETPFLRLKNRLETARPRAVSAGMPATQS